MVDDSTLIEDYTFSEMNLQILIQILNSNTFLATFISMDNFTGS